MFGEIGAGGMASVHLARFLGTAGFARTVAIKRPLTNLQQNHDFRRLARREALLAARVQHPNVVATLDVIDAGPELLIVMEYVHGATLSTLAGLAREQGQRVPLDIAVSLLGGVLRGLSAVHQARNERGELLGLVHRDVSPQNILCGADGVARLADFGLAKASGEVGLSNSEEFKGKLTYAAPEQVELLPLTYAADLYAVGVVLWELCTGERMYRERTLPELIAQLLHGPVVPPSQLEPSVPAALEAVVMMALARDPQQRPTTALKLAAALEESVRPASLEATAHWVNLLAADALRARALRVTEAESETTPSQRQPPLLPDQAAQRGGVSVSAAEPAAQQVHAARSLVRDETPPAVSKRAGALRKVVLPMMALIAGATVTWWLGQRWWPRLPAPAALPAQQTREALSAPPAEHPAASPSTPPLAASPAAVDQRGVGGTRSTLEQAAAQGAERPVPPPVSSPVSRAAARSPERSSRGGNGAAGASCDPPYSLDAEGIRHMKPGCQ